MTAEQRVEGGEWKAVESRERTEMCGRAQGKRGDDNLKRLEEGRRRKNR